MTYLGYLPVKGYKIEGWQDVTGILPGSLRFGADQSAPPII